MAKDKKEKVDKKERVKKERKPKPVITADMAEVDGEGRFTATPTLDEGQSILNFAGLKKENFANEATFLDYKAMCMEARIEKSQKAAVRLREQAELSRKYGDTKLRKKAKKLMAARDAIADLEAELSAAGIEL